MLGVKWLPHMDAFPSDILSFSHDGMVTKRLVLSCLACLFDLLEFVVSVSMGIKILFKKLWCAGLIWDEPLPQNLQHEFLSWIFGLTELTQRMVSCQRTATKRHMDAVPTCSLYPVKQC